MVQTATRKAPLPTLVKSWERYLRKQKRSPFTIRNYLRSLRLLAAWLEENGRPTALKDITGDDITDWLDETTEQTSEGNASYHYRNIVAFWSWVVKEEKILKAGKNPMLEVGMPKPDDIRRPPLSMEQVSALLKTCRGGRRFLDLRDAAIIRVFADTGMRLGGLHGLLYNVDHDQDIQNVDRNDVFLDHSPSLLRLRLKGGKQHLVDISPTTAVALDRYLRARAEITPERERALWISQQRRQLSRIAIQTMLRNRGRAAGIPGSVHPHRFRRSMATWHLDEGGSREALMARAGWTSSKMIDLYVSESKERLAWKESQAMGIADRL